MKAVILFSGGLDSVATVLKSIELGFDPILFFIDYGQKAAKGELKAVEYFCGKFRLGLKKIRMSLRSLSGSSILHLTPDVDSLNELKGRNLWLLSIALIYAGDEKIKHIFIGSTGMGGVWPDTSKHFIDLVNNITRFTESVHVHAPLMGIAKQEIVDYLRTKDINLNDTYSCYYGSEVSCGKCHHCSRELK